MTKPLPSRRYTVSREAYWRSMFNNFSRYEEDHAVSGWSAQGLHLRMASYLEILPELHLKPKAQVLDLGCGVGAYSRLLGKAGFCVIGLDFATQVVQKAGKKTTMGNVRFSIGDATCLPFSGKVFEHILCVGLFQSLHDHLPALAEIFRVLKPGGVLCLMTLNKRCLKHQMDRIFKKEEIIVVNGLAQSRLKTYSPIGFKSALQTQGFERIHLQPVQIYPEKFNRFDSLIKIWNHFPVLNYLTARSFLIYGYKPHCTA